MKKLQILVVLGILVTSFSTQSQNIVKVSKEHKLSAKAAKPGAMVDFAIDVEKSEISLKYITKDNKRKILTETYTYDLGDLKQKDVGETEFEKEKARKTFRLFDDSEPTRFVRVKNNMAGQMVLERGYILTTVYDGYSTTSFNTEQKEKFKEEDNRKQTMVAYRTDAQAFSFNLNSWGDVWQPKAGFKATGNALIMTMVKPKRFAEGESAPGQKFNTLIVASEDFSIKSEKEITFEFPHYPFAGVNTPDGGIAVVFRPMNKGALAGYSIHMANKPVKQNQKEYTLLTIDKEGNETGRYTFEVPHLNIKGQLSLTNEGDYLFCGYADELDVAVDNDKASNFMPNTNDFQASLIEAGLSIGAPEFYVVAKISKTGETIYSNSVHLKKTLEEQVIMAGEKVKVPKADKWDKFFKAGVSEGIKMEVDNNLYVQLNNEDFYQMLQFNDKGEFVTSYFTAKTGDKLAESAFVEGPEDNMYWANFEFKEGNPGETWMKINLIDPVGKKILASEIPGDKKYFYLGLNSFAPAPGELVLYFKKGKNIYLGKLPVQ